jgi:deoxyribonuclease-2
MYFYSKILIFILLIFLSNCDDEKVCRNPNGVAVDWFVIFFLPKLVSSEDEIYYAYFDNISSSLKYYIYDDYTFPPSQIASYVIDNFNSKDFNYFFWNDDLTVKDGVSKSASASKAHAKGSLVYDKKSGAFLLHSLPRFPTRTEENEILLELPSNAGSYGQHFLCISIAKATAEKIAELLNYINISNNFSVDKDYVNSEENEWISKLIENRYYSSYPGELQTTIKSKKGVEFNFLSKSHLNQVTPYDTTIRDIYLDDFYVRTWTKPSLAPAVCEEYSLFNVENVQYGDYGYAKGSEHSKWAVSVNKNIVCFGDLNHCESQQNRGGNIVCFENKKLHDIIIGSIIDIDTCIE